MPHLLIVAAPISLLWVLVTGRVTLGSLLVGFVIGLGIALGLRRLGVRPTRRLTVDQLVAIGRYGAYLAWNGLRSSVQVARIILRPRLELHTGIVALHTGDRSEKQRLTALSAHGLNMSPGQLVVDFSDDGTLYVHCIDLDAVQPTLEAEQAERTLLLRRILGERGDA